MTADDTPPETSAPDTTDQAQPFRDAESWLASQGIERDPIVVRAQPERREDAPPATAPSAASPAGPDDGRAPVGTREAVRLATEAPAPPEQPPAEAAAEPVAGRLEDEVRKAVSTAQRITAQAPQSENRLRDKLSSRDLPRVVVDLALERCRELGLVDDLAMARSLVEERRGQGHAVARIRKDLTGRGFTSEVLDQLLARAEQEDPEAAAFAVARQRAQRLASLEAETALRRLTGFLVRRGYPEGLCRKVAREVVYADREGRWVAER